MTDSIPTSLTEFPEDVMRKILEKCDFVAIQNLRRTCHNIRNFIDETKPKQSFNVIEINGVPGKISLVFYEKGVWELYPNGQKMHVLYQQIDNENSNITWFRSDRNRLKIIGNSNFLDLFSRDFGAVLNSKLSILDHLFIRCDENEIKKIQETLESSGQIPLRVHTLAMADATCQEDVLEILPYTCPETLHHLEITCPRGAYDTWDISRILELEHWKKAEELNMRRIPVRAGIQNFEHFEIAKACFEEVTVDDVMKVKENFLNSPSTTKHLQLFFHRFPNQDHLIESFGQPYRNSDNFFIAQQKSWFFRRADNYVLFIDLSGNFLVFNIKTLKDVPQGVEVIG
ncbi:unnamed protein product [Caenorhabditis brenneri]